MELIEKTISSRTLYKGRILNLKVDEVTLPNGGTSVREVIAHGGAAAVAAFDEEGKLLLVRQYRYPVGAVLTELPAGKLEPGEAPETGAARELEEETGYRCGRLLPLGRYLPAAAYDTEVIHLYLAQEVTVSHQKLDEDEFLSLVRMPFEEAVQKVLDGEIEDGKTIAGILKIKALTDAGRLPLNSNSPANR